MPALELILARNLLEAIVLAGFLLDGQGDLVYFNRPAEELLGERFQDGSGLRLEEWSSRFGPFDEFGELLPLRDLPVAEALRQGLPATARFTVGFQRDHPQEVEVIALPLGPPGGLTGALVVFWAAPRPQQS